MKRLKLRHKSSLILIAILGALFSSTILAVQIPKTFFINDLASFMKVAEQAPDPKGEAYHPDLRTGELEMDTKGQIIREFIHDEYGDVPALSKYTGEKRFRKIADLLRAKARDESDLYKSWTEEVVDALTTKKLGRVDRLKNRDLFYKYFKGSSIDVAKHIAMREFFMQIPFVWNKLKYTTFNEPVRDRWCVSPIRLHKENLENPLNREPYPCEVVNDRMKDYFFYNAPLSDERSYVFTFEMGGTNRVDVNRNLKTGRVTYNVDSHDDYNTPELSKADEDSIRQADEDELNNPPDNSKKDAKPDDGKAPPPN